MALDRVSDAMNDAMNDAMWPALAVSIGMHAAVIVGLPALWTYQPAPVPDAITAWIEPARVTPVEAPPQPALEQPRVPERVQAPPRPKPPQRKVRSQPPPTTSAAVPAPQAAAPVVAPAPEPAVAEQTEAAPPTGNAPPATPQADTEVAVAGPSTFDPRASEPRFDLGSLAQYRLALFDAARRYKLYPPNAIDRGWEGKVEVRLVIGADGELARTQIKSSSGHEVLDRQAVEMMKRAKRLTPIPPALRNHEFAVEIPVVFELRTEY